MAAKTFRTENDRSAGLFERVGHREIIADSAFPRFQHVYVIKSLASNGRAAAPAKIPAGLAQHGGYRAVPRRSEAARQRFHSRTAGNNPAIGRSRADAPVVQRRDQLGQPAARQAHVGIRKCEHFEFVGRQGLDGALQVVDFFPTICGRTGNDDVYGLLAGGLHTLDYLQSGIQAGCQRKIYFVVRIIEARQRQQIFFQPALVAFAGTDQRRRWRIETCMRSQALPHHLEPRKPFPEGIQTDGYLRDDQNVKKYLHGRENNKIAAGVAQPSAIDLPYTQR